MPMQLTKPRNQEIREVVYQRKYLIQKNKRHGGTMLSSIYVGDRVFEPLTKYILTFLVPWDMSPKN